MVYGLDPAKASFLAFPYTLAPAAGPRACLSLQGAFRYFTPELRPLLSGFSGLHLGLSLFPKQLNHLPINFFPQQRQPITWLRLKLPRAGTELCCYYCETEGMLVSPRKMSRVGASSFTGVMVSLF